MVDKGAAVRYNNQRRRERNPGTPHGVCGRSSSGRAPPCQGGGSEFEPRRPLHFCGSLAQLGEHLPYKAEGQRFEPVNFHHCGPVAQLVRAPACHAGGRRFEPDPGRCCFAGSSLSASVAQSVEQGTENPRVIGSIPIGGTICGRSSSGRAPPCQGGGSEFEPRRPLQTKSHCIT